MKIVKEKKQRETEIQASQINEKKEEKTKQENFSKRKISLWMPFIFLFALFLAFAIALAAESFQTNSVIVCITLIIVLLFLAFTGDVFAMSVTYAEPGNMNALASKKIKGAKMASTLIKNKDRVSSILSDILGDVCATISGAMGVALTVLLVKESFTNVQMMIVAASVSALIAATGVLIKAIAKRVGMKYSTKIVLFFGRTLSIFKK